MFDLDEYQLSAFTVGATHHHAGVAQIHVGLGEGVMMAAVRSDAVAGRDIGSESQGEGCGKGIAVDVGHVNARFLSQTVRYGSWRRRGEGA